MATRQCIRAQAYAQEQTKQELNAITQETSVLLDKIELVKKSAIESQRIVESGCDEIRRLDTGKQNVQHAIKTLKSLNMLVVGIE